MPNIYCFLTLNTYMSNITFFTLGYVAYMLIEKGQLRYFFNDCLSSGSSGCSKEVRISERQVVLLRLHS